MNVSASLLILQLVAPTAQDQQPAVGDRSAARLVWGDCDADGLEDILLVESGRLLRNVGEGTFDDVTDSMGLDYGRLRDAAWEDYDGDQFLDLFVIDLEGTGRLLQNTGGGFVEVHDSSGSWSLPPLTRVEWTDYDRDERPDLVLSTEVGQRLLHNSADGSFEAVDLPYLLPTTRPGVDATVARKQPAVGTGAGRPDQDTPDSSDLGNTGPGTQVIVPSGKSTKLASAICASAIKDAATGMCLAASSMPQLGALYPLGPELMIDLAGNVGIGTLTPNARLDVAGNARVESLVLDNGVNTITLSPGQADVATVAKTPVGQRTGSEGPQTKQFGTASTLVLDGPLSVPLLELDAGGGQTHLSTVAEGGGFGVELSAECVIVEDSDGNRVCIEPLVTSDGMSQFPTIFISAEESGGANDFTRALFGVATSANNLDYGTVSGGFSNGASGGRSTVAGGDSNFATGYRATVSGGASNTAAEEGSLIAGGNNNQANNIFSTVGGGKDHRTNGDYSVVSGGINNVTSATGATIGGGNGNRAGGTYATVAGGNTNTADGVPNNQLGTSFPTIGGGQGNKTTAGGATIAGGLNNLAQGDYVFIGGGSENTTVANAIRATIAGGFTNTAGAHGFVGGGTMNDAIGSHSVVAGGRDNEASGAESSVGGGDSNVASGNGAVVPGGESNTASGDDSLAAGHQAQAAHANSFVWSDGTSAPFASTGVDQFLIEASGGVGINTDNPGAFDLKVAGDICATSVTETSDARLKTDVRDLDKALATVLELRGVSFQWDRDAVPHAGDGRRIGFLAQEVREIVPEVVREDTDGTLSVSYAALVPVLVEAIREQEERHVAEREALETRMARLEASLGAEAAPRHR